MGMRTTLEDHGALHSHVAAVLEYERGPVVVGLERQAEASDPAADEVAQEETVARRLHKAVQ